MNIIFLDIDGVLNCEVFYKERAKKNGVDDKAHNNICPERVGWLNDLCKEINAKVVISSTWRKSGKQYCIEALQSVGATFEVIDITPDIHNSPRGWEIEEWIGKNEELIGCKYYDFHTYVIIDDDSDMMLNQRDHFFHVDNYGGLTPNTCYKITNFFKKLKAI